MRINRTNHRYILFFWTIVFLFYSCSIDNKDLGMLGREDYKQDNGKEKVKKPLLDIAKNAVYKGNDREFVIPFEYKSIKNDDYKFLPERFCTFIPKASKTIAVLGSLKPCIAIILEYDGNIIAAHKHYSNRIKSLIEFAKEKFGEIKDPLNELRGLLFTNKFDISDINVQKIMLECHNGKSQIEELQYIRSSILHGFGLDPNNIDNKKIIKTLIPYTTSYKDFELGDIEYAELFLAIGSGEIKPYSICPMQENLFKIPEDVTINYEASYRNLSVKTRAGIVQHYINNKTKTMIGEAFELDVTHPLMNKYDSTEFKAI